MFENADSWDDLLGQAGQLLPAGGATKPAPAQQPGPLLETINGAEDFDALLATVAPPAPAAQPASGLKPRNAFQRGFGVGLLEENPEMFAEAFEGMRHLTGRDEFQAASDYARSLKQKLGPEFAARVPTYRDVPGDGVIDTVDRALTYMGESFGKGVASTVPALVTGLTGAGIGAAAAGAPGALAGGVSGAAVSAYPQNFGELYKALKDEGVAPEQAAKWAAGGALPITGLDVFGLERMVGAPLKEVRSQGMQELAKAIVRAAGRGAVAEGTTEATQTAMQEGIVSGVTDKPFFTQETLDQIVDSALMGSFTGGGIAGGVRAASQPFLSRTEQVTPDQPFLPLGIPTTEQNQPVAPSEPAPPPDLKAGQPVTVDFGEGPMRAQVMETFDLPEGPGVRLVLETGEDITRPLAALKITPDSSPLALPAPRAPEPVAALPPATAPLALPPPTVAPGEVVGPGYGFRAQQPETPPGDPAADLRARAALQRAGGYEDVSPEQQRPEIPQPMRPAPKPEPAPPAPVRSPVLRPSPVPRETQLEREPLPGAGERPLPMAAEGPIFARDDAVPVNLNDDAFDEPGPFRAAQDAIAARFGLTYAGQGNAYNRDGRRVWGDDAEGFRSRYYKAKDGADVRISNHGTVNASSQVSDVSVEFSNPGEVAVRAQRFGALGAKGGEVFNLVLERDGSEAEAAEYNAKFPAQVLKFQSFDGDQAAFDAAVNRAIADAIAAHTATRPVRKGAPGGSSRSGPEAGASGPRQVSLTGGSDERVANQVDAVKPRRDDMATSPETRAAPPAPREKRLGTLREVIGQIGDSRIRRTAEKVLGVYARSRGLDPASIDVVALSEAFGAPEGSTNRAAFITRALRRQIAGIDKAAIAIREGQATPDTARDIAHELVHAGIAGLGYDQKSLARVWERSNPTHRIRRRIERLYADADTKTKGEEFLAELLAHELAGRYDRRIALDADGRVVLDKEGRPTYEGSEIGALLKRIVQFIKDVYEEAVGKDTFRDFMRNVERLTGAKLAGAEGSGHRGDQSASRSGGNPGQRKEQAQAADGPPTSKRPEPPPETGAAKDNVERAAPRAKFSRDDLARFVRAPDGSIDFGQISDDAARATNGALAAKPIRMERGSAEFGASHAQPERIKRIAAAGFGGLRDFISFVAQSHNQVWRQQNGRLLLVVTPGKEKVRGRTVDNTMVVELRDKGEFYGVTTVLPDADLNYKARAGRLLLWERGSTPAPAETGPSAPVTRSVDAAQDGDGGGGGQSNDQNIAESPENLKPKARREDASLSKTYARTSGWLLDAIKTRGRNLGDPLSRLPDKDAYLIERGLTQGRIARINEMARETYDVLRQSTADEAKAIFSYLTTKDAALPGVRSELQAMAVRTKRQIDQIGRALVQHGLISQEAYEKNRDAYLPRLYLKHVLEMDPASLGTGLKTSKQGYARARQDIPAHVRDVLLGEIKDPAFLSSTAISVPLRDMAILDFLDTVAKKEGWVWKGDVANWRGQMVSSFWLKEQATDLRRMAQYSLDSEQMARMLKTASEMDAIVAKSDAATADVPDGYKKLPDTKRYGALRGMRVRTEVYEDLVGAFRMIDPDAPLAKKIFEAGGIGTKATQLWKMGKVALNPPSQVRNFIGNMVLLQLSGVPFHRMPDLMIRAVREIRGNGRHWQVAKKYGVTVGTFSNTELFEINRELMDLRARQGGALPKLFQMGASVAKFAGDTYQMSEALFKTAKIIHEMGRGTVEEKAAIEAQKWLFDYSLVPQSVKYLRNAPIGAPFLCVDDTTEILTADGWKTVDQARVGDLAASFDTTTQTLKWRPIADIYQSAYDGKMVRLKDRHLDILMTPNHRCVTYRRRRVPGLRAANATTWSLEIVKAGDLNTRDSIPVAAPFEHVPTGEPISDDMASLLGWIVTEGCWHSKCKAVLISQKEGAKADVIRSLLARVAPGQWSECTAFQRQPRRPDERCQMVSFYIGAKIGRVIRDLLPGKHLTPALLRRMSVPQIRLLVDAMIDGDGHRPKNGNQPVFVQNGGPTAEAFKMALVMLGRSFGTSRHGNGYTITLRSGTRYALKRTPIETVRWSGRIWCPRVEDTATWVARRNGKVFITHNTFYYKSFPRMIEVAATKPWRFLPYIALIYGITQTIKDDYEVDDKDLDALKLAFPKWIREQNSTFLLPWKDEKGRWQAMNFGYFFPWSMPYEVATQIGKGDITKATSAAGLLGGPVSDLLVALRTNIDPFTQKPIADKRDPPSVQLQNILTYLWRMGAPPWLTDIGFVKSIADATSGTPKKSGEPGLTVEQAALRAVGVSIYPLEPERTRAENLKQLANEIATIKARRTQTLKDQSLSPEQRERTASVFNEWIKEKSEALAAYSKASEINPKLRTGQ